MKPAPGGCESPCAATGGFALTERPGKRIVPPLARPAGHRLVA